MDIPLIAVALFMGVSLGMLGTGGAIIAVPAMVYLEGLHPTIASAYSYVIVSCATAIGAVSYVRHGWVDKRAVSAFALSTIPTIVLIRSIVLPAIPQDFAIGSFDVHLDTWLMAGFAVVLALSGVSMLRKVVVRPDPVHHFGKLALLGVGIGMISGMLGAGGGFIITPALVMWAGLDMRRAVGTSLVLICINGLAGILGDVVTGQTYDVPFTLQFAAITCSGVFIGSYMSKRITADTLRFAFGCFVLLLAAAIVFVELLMPSLRVRDSFV